jgi:hypothetical protein
MGYTTNTTCTAAELPRKDETCHIDRFGTVDGIVLRPSEDLQPGMKEIVMRVRASSLNEDRRSAAVRRRRRGRSDRRRS